MMEEDCYYYQNDISVQGCRLSVEQMGSRASAVVTAVLEALP